MMTTTPTIGEPKPATKKRERGRRRRVDRPDEAGARYFLVKSSGASQMELGEETPTENDAMVTSFRSGGTFAVVTEWKTNVDLADGHPVIKKEAVRRERS